MTDRLAPNKQNATGFYDLMFYLCKPAEVLGTGSGLCCGMAMSRVPAGESPAQITASHGSGIEPCRFAGNGGLDA